MIEDLKDDSDDELRAIAPAKIYDGVEARLCKVSSMMKKLKKLPPRAPFSLRTHQIYS